MRKLYFLFFLAFLPLVVSAQVVEIDGIYYNLNSSGDTKTAEVTQNPNRYSGDIVIPETVTYNEVIYSVTSIGTRAFDSCNDLTSVTIPNSVISIGDYAFMACSGLTSVIIPNSVTSIGFYAFFYCSSLLSITIPNSVNFIGASAFQGTAWYNNKPDGLIYAGKVAYKYKGEMPVNTAITLENGTLGISPYAFSGCSGLISVTIPNSVTSIGYHAFSDCTSLTSVTIPNSVTSIGNMAFHNCSGMTSVIISNSVTSIGSGAFSDCTSLTSVTIPNSVTSIGDTAFYGCSSLTSVTIPNSVNSIGASAFQGTAWYNNQPDGLVYAGKVAYYYKGKMPVNTAITLESGTLGIAKYAFFGCSGLTSVTIPNSVISIGLSPFSGCSGLTSIVVEDGNTIYDSRDNSNAIIETSTNTLIAGCKNSKIPNSVISIGNSAFHFCKGLTSITIPKNVTSIGERAFTTNMLVSLIVESENTVYDSRDNCNAIIETSTNTLIVGCQNTKIPNSVVHIGSDAFYNCNGLKNIIIPEGVKTIDRNAFSSCFGLEGVELPSSLTNIGYAAFRQCTKMKTVISYITNPGGVLSSNDVFDSSSATLYVPQSSIDAYKATEGWSSFKNVLPLEDILANIEFADAKVKEICVANWDTNGDGELSKLEALEVSDIGNKFRENKEITSFDELQYFKGLTFIYELAFSGCDKLGSVVIPNSVTSLQYAVFQGCHALTSITIPESLTSINNTSFINCSGLTTIKVDNRNPVFDSRDDCNAIIRTSANSLVIGCKNTIFPNSLTIIGSCAFEGCTGLTSITISDGITTIEESAFFGCSGLTSVVIPKNVTSIKSSAFASCNNLASIIVEADNPKYDSRDNCNAIIETATNTLICGFKNTVIPNTVICLEDYSFAYCENLTAITIPNSVTSIGESAFSYCGHLTSIEIPNSVTTIGNSAFLSCSSLSSITVENGNPKYDSRDNCNAIIETATNTLVAGCKTTVIPSSVTTIGKYSFNQLGFMTFTIPGTVKTIEKSAFNNCYMLSSINISEGVETIGPSAFSSCYMLESVELPSTLKSIGTLAFQSCREMKKVISHMEDPFALTDNIFGVIEWSGNTGEWVSYLPNITLYVPAGTKDKYAALAGWKDFKEIVEMAETTAITIGKSGKASYCGDQSLDFSFSDEIKAYIATGFDKDEEIIWLTRVKDVPAGVPVLIKGVANQIYNVPVTNTQNSSYTNMFKGNTSGATIQVNETDGDLVNYYLSGDGTFKSVKGYANIGNNKSYLQLPGTFAPAEAGATQTVKVGSAGKASYAAPVDLDFTNVEGLKAFTATGYDKSSKTIWLTRVMKVQKGEGVLLKGDPKDYEIPSSAIQSSYKNMFVGNTSGASVQVQETSDDGSQTNFYLKGDGTFVSVNGYVNIGNNKCYLELPTSMVSTAASTRAEASYLLDEPEVIKLPILYRSLDSEGNGTTAIKEVKSGEVKGEKWFTLQGQRVENHGKGIYIKNGKKIIVK